MRSSSVPLLLLAATLLATPAAAQDDPGRESVPPRTGDVALSGPLIVTARLTEPPAIDGVLDEAVWRTVEPATRFTQTEPLEGRPASQRTEVYILFDDDALYIGARLWDTEGDVRSRLGRRDSYLADSDWFYVTLDSHHDHLTAYQFAVNPAGVKRDEKQSGGGHGDGSWDAIWDVATRVDADGWTAELRIPFSQLRFAVRDEHVWGLQLSRRINRNQEVSVLAFTPKSERGGVAAYGHLLGLQGLASGRRFELLPYSLARAEYLPVDADDPFRDGSDFSSGVGLDLKYRVTSALTLDATVNPDFGQVEVDPAVVNLSAFETSFDEKRPFFVEGNDIFRFGSGGEGRGAGGVYYSRRIGRSPQGSLPEDVAYADVPDASTIAGAAKLTGRTPGGWAIGVLGAVTGEETAPWVLGDGTRGRSPVEPRTGYAVARLRKSLRAGQTNVGVIGTAMRRQLGDSALAASLRRTALTTGLDFTHEFLDRNWSVEGAITGSFVEGSEAALIRTQRSSARYYHRPDADYLAVDSALTSLGGYSARLEIGKRAGLHWRGEASVSATSPGYEINDVGFQTTVDRISSGGNVTYVENQPGSLFRNYRITLSGQGGWNYGRDLVEARVSTRLDGQLLNYWGGNLNLTRSFATYDDRLTRGGPVTRDLAGYNVGMNINSDNRRPVSGRLNSNYSWGDSGGWHSGTSVNLNVRPAPNWTFSIGPRLDRSLGMAQYRGAITDTLMSATFGRRYLFSEIRQTTWSMETRVNLNVTPELSLDLYAQPFISAGDYGTPRQLARPRAWEFQTFGEDAGTMRYDPEDRSYTIDPDGTGPAAPFTLANADFSSLSLRGNAVVRWEWRPGSTLYFVWQQRRAARYDSGEFDFGAGVGDMFGARPSSVYVVKLNYWLNL